MIRYAMALACAAMVFLGASTAHAYNEPALRCWAVATYLDGKTPVVLRTEQSGKAGDEKSLSAKMLFSDFVKIEHQWSVDHGGRKLKQDSRLVTPTSRDPNKKSPVDFLCSSGSVPDRVKGWPAATYHGKSTLSSLAIMTAKYPGVGAPLLAQATRDNLAGQTSGFYCAGVIWYRRHDGDDLGPMTPIWGTIKGVPEANKTSAESAFRKRLISKLPEGASIFADASHGIPSGDVQVCWQGKPPTAPMGWSEEKRGWSAITANPESYVTW